MAKLSKSTRTVVIAAAVLLVLGAVCLVLLLTSPSDDKKESSPDTATSNATTTEAEAIDTSFVITDREGTEVTKAEITNTLGSFTFMRESRTVSDAEEYYWTSEQLKGAPSNDTLIKAFMNCLAGLKASELVEENASDLDKYGLKSPVSTTKITFADGAEQTVHFGIQNPSEMTSVYCRKDGSSDVYLISYYSVGDVYYGITDFVDMSITEGYSAENPQELDYFIIERKDLEEPIEISYMYDVQAEAEKDSEEIVVTTFNSHRMTTPIIAEVDAVKGQTVCYGVYGLSASHCVSVDPDEALLAETGLDDPHCKLTFKYGDNRYVMFFGNEIVNITESEDESAPDLKTVVGYYGMVEGSDIIYAFTTDSVPWYDLAVEDIVSRRPVTPYIYTCDSVVVTTPERVYEFKINGNASDSSFTLDGVELDNYKFRELYQHLIAAVGEEIYRVDGDYEPFITVQLNYRDKYHYFYGAASDKIEYFKSDDRKNIVKVNGEVLFKVRQVYTERLLENIEALISGGDLVLNW